MNAFPTKPERLAELEDLARRRGTSTAETLDEALAAHLEWERQDYQEAVAGIRQGYQDVKAGRSTRRGWPPTAGLGHPVAAVAGRSTRARPIACRSGPWPSGTTVPHDLFMR